MDWNAVVHLLDELRDEPRSLLDLPRAFSRYDRPSLLQSLLYLSDQDLISISESRYPHEPVPKSEWQRRLRQALDGQRSGAVESAAASVETSDRGHRILELFGIGNL
jgi:hypothetical protein